MVSLNSSKNEYKDRVYVALYGPADPTCKKTSESFRWAFHVSPKDAPHASFHTARYQLEKRTTKRSDGTIRTRWVPEQEFGLDTRPDTLLVEVQIGGIQSTRHEFEECLRQVKIKQHDPEFSDREWVQQALLILSKEHVLTKTSILQWDVIERTIVNYYLQQLEKGTRGSPCAPIELSQFAIAT